MGKYDSYFKNTTPVPHADSNGRQEGVVPPGLRNYKPGVYKVVDNATATANMAARQKGEMALIKDGQDNPTERKGKVEMPIKQSTEETQIPPKMTVPSPRAEPVEKDSDWGPKSSEFDLTDDDGVIDVQGPDPRLKSRTGVDYNRNAELESFSEIGQYSHYMPTQMVTLEIRQEHADGTYSSVITVGLPVCKIVQNSVSITLVSPIVPGQYTFQPAAGSDILLNGGGLNNVHVFFPGTGFTLDDWKISGMCFVKAN